MKEKNSILDGSIHRALIAFFVPCLLGMSFQQLYCTVDTWIVGNLVCTAAVAAVGNVASIVSLIIGICAGIASGAGVVVSQHFGAGKTEQVRADIRCGMTLAVVIGIFLTALCAPLSKHIVLWMQTPSESLADSATYLRVYLLALIPNLIYNFGTAILRGMGDSKRPLYILIVASMVNILLDLLFVIVFHWDVFGVALATDLSQVVSAVMVIYLLFKAIPDRQGKGGSVYRSIFRIGLPTAFQSIMYSSSNILIQVAINGFSTAMMAAWTIYGKVDCICWMTMSSMGMAVTAFAGQNFGAQQYERIKRCAWVSSVMLVGALVVLIGICYFAAPWIFAFFSDDALVCDYGTHMLRFLTPAYMLYFLIEILPGILHGCGDVFIPTIASIVGICLIRVIWLAFVVPIYHSIDMVMMSYVITWAITSIFYVIYFIKGNWLKRCIEKSAKAEARLQ